MSDKNRQHRQRVARINQRLFSTPHIRYMFAGHALETRWMGAICALSAGIFKVFSSRKSQSHVVGARLSLTLPDAILRCLQTEI